MRSRASFEARAWARTASQPGGPVSPNRLLHDAGELHGAAFDAARDRSSRPGRGTGRPGRRGPRSRDSAAPGEKPSALLMAAVPHAVQRVPSAPCADDGARLDLPIAAALGEPHPEARREPLEPPRARSEAHLGAAVFGPASQPRVERLARDSEGASGQPERNLTPARRVDRALPDRFGSRLELLAETEGLERVSRRSAERNSPQTLRRGKRSFSSTRTRRPAARAAGGGRRPGRAPRRSRRRRRVGIPARPPGAAGTERPPRQTPRRDFARDREGLVGRVALPNRGHSILDRDARAEDGAARDRDEELGQPVPPHVEHREARAARPAGTPEGGSAVLVR